MTNGGDRLESDYYDYMGFDSEHTKSTLRHYVPFFSPPGPVVELAPGRGEFLSLMAEAGITAYGVDIDEGMVERAAAAGLDVRGGDAIAHLEEVEPGSVGGVFSAHLVEHLEPDDVERVARAAARALRPGGTFVAASPNPACLSVLGADFWRDPTHVRFYHPQLLAFLCHRAGLAVVETGTNPANVGGIPPGLAPVAAPGVTPRLSDLVADSVRQMDEQVKRRGSDPPGWHLLGHAVSVLDERVQQAQEDLAALHRAYSNLLDTLYQSNEIYVVARARA